MRDLEQNPGAIPGVDFAAARAAMAEVVQDLQRLLHNRMRLSTFDVGDKTDAARVVFMGRIVETLFGR